MQVASLAGEDFEQRLGDESERNAIRDREGQRNAQDDQEGRKGFIGGVLSDRAYAGDEAPREDERRGTHRMETAHVAADHFDQRHEEEREKKKHSRHHRAEPGASTRRDAGRRLDAGSHGRGSEKRSERGAGRVGEKRPARSLKLPVAEKPGLRTHADQRADRVEQHHDKRMATTGAMAGFSSA